MQKYLLVKKENEILKRTVDRKRLKLRIHDRDRRILHCLVSMNRKLSKVLTLVTPETVLYKWQDICKSRWRYKGMVKRGRKPLSPAIKKLIIGMKRSCPLWGCRRIAGELFKVGHDVKKSTVHRVIQVARKKGDIMPAGSWKRFMTSHIKSLFACDFFTVETAFSQRLYVFFIIRILDRKIVQYGITKRPDMAFVKNQLKAFMFDRLGKETFLIHDNSGELRYLDYSSLGIKGVATVPYSPNLNAYAERFIRSARSECLDWFIVMGRKHLNNLVRGYVKYYNNIRPHQGLGNDVPAGYMPQSSGRIKSVPVLYGLHRQYYRSAA